uniref:Uncharacterized protein n=1 Tax=Ditylum brightwellii TaxID=49249 RepID=A0A7S4VF29_9STRA
MMMMMMMNGNNDDDDEDENKPTTLLTTKQREIQFAMASQFTEHMEERAYWHYNCGDTWDDDFPKLCKKSFSGECFVRLCRWKTTAQADNGSHGEEEEERGNICWQGFFKCAGLFVGEENRINKSASHAILSSLPEIEKRL